MKGSLSAQAVTLNWGVNADWTDTSWSSGHLTQSFNVDGIPGNDITIDIYDPNDDISSTVDNNNNYTGGYGTNEQSLYIQATGQSTNQYIQVTITFLNPGGVQNVNFELFDVDYANGQFRDVISSIDATRNGSAVGTASLTDSLYNNISLTDSGSSPFYQGPYAYGVTTNSEQHDDYGNVGVSFGSTVLDQISFRYYNQNETGQQAITLYDINYTPVPEPSTYLSGILLVLVIGWQLKNKKQNVSIPNAA